MYKECDVVEAIQDLSTNVKAGCLGTILICYSNSEYEVEFLNDNGESLDVLTVAEGSLRLKKLN